MQSLSFAFQAGAKYQWDVSTGQTVISGPYCGPMRCVSDTADALFEEVVDVPSVGHPMHLAPRVPEDKTFVFSSYQLDSDQPTSPNAQASWSWTVTIPKDFAALASYSGAVTLRLNFTVYVSDGYAPSDAKYASFKLDVSQWLLNAKVVQAIFSRGSGYLQATVMAVGTYAFQGVAPLLKGVLEWRVFKIGDPDTHAFRMQAECDYAGAYFDIAWDETSRDSDTSSLDSSIVVLSGED